VIRGFAIAGRILVPACAAAGLGSATAFDDDASVESAHYRILTIPVPDGIVLEVGGILCLEPGSVMVCTRRGEVWRIDGATGEEGDPPRCTLFAEGLQEPLGLLRRGGGILAVQRGELSELRDADGDGRADWIGTVSEGWPISGNYHEYNFGPCADRDGHLWITTNKPFGDEPFGRADWRGWALRIGPDGAFAPVCCGLRSPAGVQASPWGDVFYTDNQGEWCGASKLSHLEPGDFHGHPWGTFSAKRADSPIPFPGDPDDGTLMPLVKQKIPAFKLPAVWFPYDKMGKSPAGFEWDQTGGRFGPFAGQVFVGDQHHASVLRVSLERVRGHWQGACYPFRAGFQSGITRVAFAADGSLYVGMTNRGWGSRGRYGEGLQRLVHTGVAPFEILAMKARPDGFELELTAPVDPATACAASSYKLESYTYKLHSEYGSPEVDRRELSVEAAVVAADSRSVRLAVPGLREGYVHELHAPALRARDGRPLLHPEAYYTLIHLPPAE